MTRTSRHVKAYEYPLFLAYAAAVLLPLLMLAFNSIRYAYSFPAVYINTLIPSQRTFQLLLKSTGYSAAVSAVTLITGGWCGTVLFTLKSRFWHRLRWLVLLSVLIPPYIHAMAWTELVSAINSDLSISGWGLAILVQSMYTLPVSAVFTMAALKSIQRDTIDAARTSCSDSGVYIHIILPAVLPLMLVSFAFIFIISLTDYTIPGLLGVNTYPLEIYTQFAAGVPAPQIFTASLPLLAMTVLIISIVWGYAVNAFPADTDSSQETRLKLNAGLAGEYLTAGAVIIIIIQIAVPVWLIVADAGMWSSLLDTVSRSIEELCFSLMTSTAAVIVSLPFSVAIANLVCDFPKTGKVIIFLNIILFTVPSPITGISLISTWNPVLPDALYSSILLPVTALVTRFSPLMVIILAVQSLTLEKSLTEAAVLHTDDRFRIFLHTRLKILFPGIAASSALMFILCMGELGATLLVTPPGASTLTVKIYNYLHYGSTGSIKGLCFIVLLFSLASGYMFVNSSGLKKMMGLDRTTISKGNS